MAGFISTERRLAYVAGFLELGMIAEALRELGLIAVADAEDLEVQLAWLEWQLAAKRWPGLVRRARRVTAAHPDVERGWIVHAYALRELNRVAEARAVLLEAEGRHRINSAILHYNLACYEALLGDAAAAERRLRRACRMEAGFLQDAASDPDLVALRTVLAQLAGDATRET